ncbi:MAG TPA: hypothetical protein VH080_11085 [Gemmatimonadaceae bacterium]|jgi:hypothetical protein|nr:hypothetical protein [Gemmatimonadaceae bacterium]
MTYAVARYAFVMAATIALVAWILTFALTGPGATSAITLSAGVAAIVQIAAFAITRAMMTHNVIAGWGAGSLVRFLTLFIYGLLAVKVIGLAPVPALISLVLFFFLSTLLEPLFLRR